jgi:AhpD family alkylhydroperoxidase
MDESDRLKIEKIIKDRKRANEYFTKINSKTYRSFIEMEEHTFTDNKLDKKTKELIAVGISVIKNCESCLEWHIHEALKDGAAREEIIEALEVGIEFGGGTATVSCRFALAVLDYYKV